jgi:hypothetical protein
MTLEVEAERATELLRGKVVKRVWRHCEREVVIIFEDGSHFYADADTPLELSVTLGDELEE